MPTVHETVYPRLKSAPSRRELADLYTPTEGELELAERSAKGEPARLAFLVLLKTFQRLGHFIALRLRSKQRLCPGRVLKSIRENSRSRLSGGGLAASGAFIGSRGDQKKNHAAFGIGL
jgi:hypothetical protein